MAIFDVIGVFQNGKISAQPFNPKALVPFEQPISIVQGEDLVIRMYCQNNDATGLDITNWAFECSLSLQQAPNPAQAAPPPPVVLKRDGVIVAANPPIQQSVPLGGVVTFTFTGMGETAFWFPWETDSFDIFGIQPGGTKQENFVPPSQLTVLQSTSVFPMSGTPTPAPPTPYTYIFSYPEPLPDPRTFPLSTVIRDTTTGQLLWNAGGTTWSPLPNYQPATPAQWSGTAPSTIGAALDRIAAAVYALRGNTPIP